MKIYSITEILEASDNILKETKKILIIKIKKKKLFKKKNLLFYQIPLKVNLKKKKINQKIKF